MGNPQKNSPPEIVFDGTEPEYLIEGSDAGLRLDVFLALRLPDYSRSRLQSLIKTGHVLLNGVLARPSETLRLGDRIVWKAPPVIECQSAQPEEIALEILFEDDDIIVVNKPPGMVVHPGAGHVDGTLVSALLHHCGSLSVIGGEERPGIVHRLDKETSGCLVVAKNDVAHRVLAEQFADRGVEKVYLAVVDGVPKRTFGTIDQPIRRHPVNRQMMAIARNGRGRLALTEYKVLGKRDNVSLVECHPKTGRTHQIRVHLKFLGNPVAGDPVYGKRGNWERHLLHAWKLSFDHPVTGERLSFEAPPPEEFRFA
ncbi:RluA family pseudouridine synthase [Spartobacteria bacterium LR76]|nr:RluA family pseudouridine synthase [Spartobacteria bacterium LR76]